MIAFASAPENVATRQFRFEGFVLPYCKKVFEIGMTALNAVNQVVIQHVSHIRRVILDLDPLVCDRFW